MNGLTSTAAQCWRARLGFVLAGPAMVILLVFAGLKSMAMAAVGLAAAVARASPRQSRRSTGLDSGTWPAFSTAVPRSSR
jgi:hypothetical protein